MEGQPTLQVKVRVGRHKFETLPGTVGVVDEKEMVASFWDHFHQILLHS